MYVAFRPLVMDPCPSALSALDTTHEPTRYLKVALIEMAAVVLRKPNIRRLGRLKTSGTKISLTPPKEPSARAAQAVERLACYDEPIKALTRAMYEANMDNWSGPDLHYVANCIIERIYEYEDV